MQALRNARLLTRLVLVWFALAMGAALASPIVAPKSFSLLCSGAGMKLIILAADGSAQGLDASLGDAGSKPDTPVTHALDCPACGAAVAPPPPDATFLSFALEGRYLLSAARSAHVASRSAPTLPARGPPQL